MSGQAMKSCCRCGVDVAGKPRTKDGSGNYWCKPCFDDAAKRLRKDAAAPVAAAAAAPGGPDDFGGGDDLLSGLIAETMPVEPADAGPAAACQNCGGRMQAGTVVCLRCGYNHESGKTVQTAISKEKELGKAAAAGVAVAKGGGYLLTCSIGAVVGGFVGAAIWAGIAQATGMEIGYVAILVGFLAGLGTALGARDNAGIMTGLIAAVVAVAAIFGAKVWVASNELDELLTREVNEELMLEFIAEEIREEAGGQSVRVGRRGFRSRGMSMTEAKRQAKDYWGSLTADEREEDLAFFAEVIQAVKDSPPDMNELVFESLGLFDYVFFFFALVVALGAGSAGRISFGD